MKNNIIGARFGRLIVIDISHKVKRNTYLLCKCDCGNETVVYRGALTSGDTKSCGCYHRDNQHEYGKTHGQSHTKLYKKWSSMIQRTTNTRHERYISYGGRGITICDEWYTFSAFYKWSMENGYKDGLSLERINVNGNYEPINCKFIPLVDQYENKRNSRLITYNGITQTIGRWAREMGISHQTLSYRINNWELDRVFESLPYANELIVG